MAAGQNCNGEHYKEDDLNAPTRILVEGPKGKELYKRLQDYKAKLLGIDPAYQAKFEKTLPIDLELAEK